MLTISQPPLTSDAAKFIAISNVLAGIQDYAGGGLLLPNLHDRPIHEILQRTPFAKRRVLSGDHRRLMRIAWQTELAAKIFDTIEVDQPPAALQLSTLRRVSAQTLPVQVYYALFNLARAQTSIVGSPCHLHRQVHDNFATNRQSVSPGPWGLALSGDPEILGSCLLNNHVPPDLAFNPMSLGMTPEQYVGAALRMTRRWQIELRRNDWLKDKNNLTKAGKPRKNLSQHGRNEILQRLRPTTLFDFVYELRRRTNYETTDEYGSDADDLVVDRFYRGMLYLLDSGMLIYEAEIVRSVGKQAFQEACDEWSKVLSRTMPTAIASFKKRTGAIVDIASS